MTAPLLMQMIRPRFLDQKRQASLVDARAAKLAARLDARQKRAAPRSQARRIGGEALACLGMALVIFDHLFAWGFL